MKRIILLLLSLLVVLLFSGWGEGIAQQGDSGQIETGPVFRNVNWGMTPEEVQAVETAAFKRSSKNDDGNKVLYFEPKLFDRHCELAYTFNDSERLIMASYKLQYGFLNRYEAYQEILTLLTEKYGTPYIETDYEAIWNTGRCSISLWLDSYYNLVFIVYMGPEAEEQFRQKLQKERKKNKEAL